MEKFSRLHRHHHQLRSSRLNNLALTHTCIHTSITNDLHKLNEDTDPQLILINKRHYIQNTHSSLIYNHFRTLTNPNQLLYPYDSKSLLNVTIMRIFRLRINFSLIKKIYSFSIRFFSDLWGSSQFPYEGFIVKQYKSTIWSALTVV